MFRKVMVANRGEVALRVLRTLREMGIRSVLACSSADAEHTPRLADEVICMGPDGPGRSYLSTFDIINAARAVGADAVHPGYGFLSEDPYLCRLCGEMGLAFIGPSPEALALAGEKAAVCEIARGSGIPVLFLGRAGSAEEAESLLEREDYPVALKPVAGGGGRGIRVAWGPGELRRCWGEAEREASLSFKNEGFYLERYLRGARHLEVQMLLDREGRSASLPLRDCSLQYRRQKWVEETPASRLDPKTEEAMRGDADRLCRECGIRGLATVEFLVLESEYFFLEINPRLQVEHTISEMVTGMDLVREQLRLAARLPLEDVPRPRGHAVQARVCLSGAARGTCLYLRLPGGPGVRVDACEAEGAASSSYDPLLAKVCVWAPTRREAVARLGRALGETELRGAPANLPFLRRLVESPAFLDASYDTGTLEEEMGRFSAENADRMREAAG